MNKPFLPSLKSWVTLVLAGLPFFCFARVCTNAHELAATILNESDTTSHFDLVATCSSVQKDLIFFEDASGAMFASSTNYSTKLSWAIRPGDRLRLVGHLIRAQRRIHAVYTSVTTLGHGNPPPVLPVSGSEFVSGKYDFKRVSITGRVHDIVPDETDSNFQFVSIFCDGHTVLTPMPIGMTDLTVGTRVTIRGICMPAPLISRRLIGHILHRDYAVDGITVLSPPSGSPFDVPVLKEFTALQPKDIFRLPRHKAIGRVMALWNGAKALVETKDDLHVKVTFLNDVLPEIGDTIEVAGLPETDLYNINLSKAVWTPCNAPSSVSDPPPTNIVVGDIVRMLNGDAIFNPDYDGVNVRLSGVVRQAPSSLGLDPRLYLDSGSRLVAVDLTAAPHAADGIPVGSQIEVSGVCILETEAWQPNLAFPKVTNFLLAVRRNGDIQVLTFPSFWTTGRLLAIILVLAIILIAILVWNRTLHVLVARRGHQLFREKVAHYEASLRVDERTKLAVELHDSLAQSLTGAFMELETAESLGSGASPDMLRHLQIAAATVKSCHGELRNCLWDLRNLSLDEPNLETAIRKTLAPHVRGIAVAMRFNVPRARLSDNTAHAILRIIRELVLNAVRHGKATEIQIAGCIDDGKLLFSVRDNGCGFDPDNCPGIPQGHFGLEGIRERTGLLSGDLKLESTPDKGTKATVSIVLPTADTKEKS